MNGKRSDARGSARHAVVEVDGRRLHTATWVNETADPPSVVFLHDGLGSVGQWRDVPAEVAARTGRTVLAYDRAGHGTSTPIPSGPWPADWLHTEAEVLADLLDATGALGAALVGHSDGGSIAAIHAADTATPQITVAREDRGVHAESPVVLLAAHTWTEDATVAEIVRMRERPAPFVEGLARFHDHPAEVFEAWSGVWVSDAFASWDIRPAIGAISRPVLVAQGARDEYATSFHATSSAEAIGDNAEARLLPDLGHLLHHQAPEIVVDLVVGTLAQHSAIP